MNSGSFQRRILSKNKISRFGSAQFAALQSLTTLFDTRQIRSGADSTAARALDHNLLSKIKSEWFQATSSSVTSLFAHMQLAN